MSATPIAITTEILPGKQDPSAEAHFANGQRASQYARMLVDSGDYSGGGAYLDDGETKWPVKPSA